MAQIRTHELAYSIEAMLTRRLRERRVVKAGELAGELTEKIMDFIPSEAFDPQLAWSDGVLFFHGDVDEDTVQDMQLQLTEAHLNLGKNKNITLHVSSFGGDCYAGLALCGTIQELRRQGRVVNCHIQGYAMSMGSVIAQSCDYRSIDEDAWMMVHKVKYGLPRDTKFDDHEEELEATRRLQSTLFGMYARRTGKPAEWYSKKLHKTDWYMTAQQALDEKLVDAVCAAPAFKTYRRTK